MAHASARRARWARPGADERRADSRRRMLAALAINAVLLVGTFVGALLTGSLALLADTGHMLSDVAAIVLGLVAGGIASLPGGPRRTFGYQRTGCSRRSRTGRAGHHPRLDRGRRAPRRAAEIAGLGVLLLGIAGIVGNVAATWILARGQREDLNLEGVLRHSAADALGSFGVVVSGGVILATGWADRPAREPRDRGIDPCLLGATDHRADQRVDGGGAGGNGRREDRTGDDGRRSRARRSTTFTCGRSHPAS